MPDRQGLVIEAMGQDGLGVKGVDQVDAFVILACAVGGAFIVVGAMEHGETSRRLEPGARQYAGQRNALPLADRAPALDAIVTGDLGSLRHRAEIGQRKIERPDHEPVNAQPPIGEPRFLQGRIRGRVRRMGAVDLEVGRKIVSGKFAGQGSPAAQQPLHAIGQPLGRAENLPEARGLREPVATAEQDGSQAGRAEAEELAPPKPLTFGEQNAAHGRPPPKSPVGQ